MLTQDDMDIGCAAAMARYSALSGNVASTRFAYELQGFLAACVEHGADLDSAIVRVLDLLVMVKQAQR